MNDAPQMPHPEPEPPRGSRLPAFILAGLALAAAAAALLLVVTGHNTPVTGGDRGATATECDTQTWSPAAPNVGDELAAGRVVSVEPLNPLPSGGVLARVCYLVATSSAKP